MLKKIKSFLKKNFSRKFIHPIINEKLSDAIDDKIKSRSLEQEKIAAKHTQILNSYLRTYFQKTYADQDEMAVAYNFSNKEWIKYCRKVNATEKLINLNKNAFKSQVALVVNKIKKDGIHN